MCFQDFANSLWSELQLPNKPLPRQKPTAEIFSDTSLPGYHCRKVSRMFSIHTEKDTKLPWGQGTIISKPKTERSLPFQWFSETLKVLQALI